jgi:hypothetical protein
VAHVNVVEQAYLEVVLDALFGRDALVAQVGWQRAPDRTVLGHGGALVSDRVEYLLIYAHGAVPSDWPRPQRRMPERGVPLRHGKKPERLGRRWILVEAGAPAREPCLPRLLAATAAQGGGFTLMRVEGGAPPGVK